jgi:hypothetical protein
LGQQPAWRGQTITGLRLDPSNAARSGEFNIDYLRADYVPAGPNEGPAKK